MQKIKYTKEKVAWILYDFADSSFVTIIVTVLFSLYFKEIVVGGDSETGTALWGMSISISMLLVALLAPIMGAIADFSHSRKTLLIIATLTTILFTAILYFIKPGNITSAIIIFIIANFAFSMSNVFYNAFLPTIAPPNETARLSGIAWGVGYFGGLVALLCVLPIINQKLTDYLNYRLSFVLVAIFYLIFALPAFLWLKKEGLGSQRTQSYVTIGFQRILHTVKNISRFRELLKFLISYFFYNDGITAVIAFASIYGATVFAMTPQEMIIYFVIAQPASFLGAVLFGYIMDILGAKKSINLTLLIWIIVIEGAYLCVTKRQFYLVGLGAGFAMGASQSLSRTMFAQFTPHSKSTEFFGFYGVMGRLSSLLSPLVYGWIAIYTSNQRYSILSILLFFIIGLVLLQTVDEKKGQLTALQINEEMK